MNPDVALTLDSIGKKFNDQWLFRNLNLTVPKGGSAVLIGPSGNGKSVLLKMIAGLLTCDEGQIHCSIQNIGMLFQKNALFDSFTVIENLLFPLKERLGVRGQPAKKRAEEFLAAVGLAGTEDLYPDEISGGMQKRLGIARALIVEPDLILYDEPTAGLDPITSRTIADLICALRAKSGTTLITVTNDMQRAYQIADQIYLLANGTLLPGGSPLEVQSSKSPALRQFIYGLAQGPLTSEI
jgi:phospholipid/cholesterol/gamma-HCH transport system ATP-binding protein